MFNVLLIGSSSGVIDIAKKIKGYGFRLIVLGGIQNDPAHSLADKSIFNDYSDINSCISACKNLDIKFIVPGSNDIAFDCALAIAADHGIQTFDAQNIINQLHNKMMFRQLIKKLSISQPKIFNKNELKDLNFARSKIIVKPNLAFSGNGITVVDGYEKLDAAIKHATKISRNGEITLEQFISGGLFSISTFVSKEEIALSFFANEFCRLNPFAVDYSFTPSNLPSSSQSEILKDVDKIIKYLNLKDGLLHIQFIYDENEKKYYFIECMRRMIGDFYGKKISLAYNVDYTDLYIKPYLNKKIVKNNLLQNPKEIHRKVIGYKNTHFFESITVAPDEKVIEFIPLATSGIEIKEFPHGKSGILFFEKDNNQC